MSCILAIDQSTSATKALLFDPQGNIIAQASREHRQIYPRPGFVEHDAQEIYANTIAVVRELTQQRPDEVRFVSIANQRETAVVFDRATGRPLHNAIVWQCRRGEGVCEELRRDGHEELFRARTGLKIDPYFSASKITWLMRHDPQIAARLHDGSAVIGTIDACLIHRLTGGGVFASDATNASRTLLLDIHRRQWDGRLCEVFGIPPGALPQVRDCTSRFGETDFDGALPRPAPICGVMGDSQAALLAQRCFAPGDVKVTFGTGSSVLLNVGADPRITDGGSVSTIAWTHNGTPTYCHEGIINSSAATVAWLKDQLGLLSSAAESEAIAQSVADNGGVYIVPAFAGLGAPYWKPSARAAIVGLTQHSGRAHLVRAALESIVYQVRDVLDMMRAQAGVELRVINADGGPTRNRLLMQFLADIVGLEIHVCNVPECSALGAAMSGLLGMGHYDSIGALATLPRQTTIYRPAMPQAKVDSSYAGWKAAVAQVIGGA